MFVVSWICVAVDFPVALAADVAADVVVAVVDIDDDVDGVVVFAVV